jgi:hypothetical protein
MANQHQDEFIKTTFQLFMPWCGGKDLGQMRNRVAAQFALSKKTVDFNFSVRSASSGSLRCF